MADEDRTVTVRLRAEVDQYIASMGEAAAATQTLRAAMEDVGGTDTSPELDRVGSSAEQAAEKADKLTASSHSSSSGLHDTGEAARSATADIEDLDTALGQLAEDAAVKGEQAGAGFSDGFGAGGEKAARNFAENFAAHEQEFTAFAATFSDDWFKQFDGNSEAALDKLNSLFNEKFDSGGLSASSLFWDEFDTRAKRAVEDLGGGNGGNGPGLLSRIFSGSGVDQFAEIPGTIAENLWPIVITGAIAAAPAIGATIAGGITAAIGAAAIGGGIALQINNPEVHAAATTLANDLEHELKSASSGFVEPTKQAIGTIDAMLISEGPRFKAIFDDAAPSVEAIASGVANFVDRLMPGIEAITKASFPVMDEISQNLPGLGVAVRDFFDDVANSGKGAGEAIVAAFKVAEFSLEGTGVVIEALAKSFDYLINNPVANLLGGYLFQKFFNDVKSGSDTSGKSLNDFAGNSDQAAASLTQLDNALQKATTDFDKLIGLNVGAEQAQDRFREGLEQLTKAVQQNGVSLDQNSLAGAKVRDVLATQVTNIKNARDAYISQQTPILGVTKATEQANVIFGQNIVALETQAVKAGLSQSQVDALIRSLLGLPPSKSSTVSTPGAQTSKDAIDSLGRSINSLPTYKEIDVVTMFTSKTDPNAQKNPTTKGGYGGLMDPNGGWLGTIHHAETGGVFDAGVYSHGPILFAEPQTGGEAFVPRLTSDEGRARAVTEQAAGWHGGHVMWGDQPYNPPTPLPISGSSPIAPGTIAAELASVLHGPLGDIAHAVQAGRSVSVQIDGREVMRATDKARRDSKWVG
jgi:hypothetical protein